MQERRRKSGRGLYGLSGAFQRKYSSAGVPERFEPERPTESWDRLRCPRGVVFHGSPATGLRALRWLWGLVAIGGRRL